MTINANILEDLLKSISSTPRTWFLTGAAGFIGSHLLEFLLTGNQRVVAIDNFATGKIENLEDVERRVGAAAWKRCAFYEADICDYDRMSTLIQRAEIVLHQAALGSVPRSIEDPLATNRSNVSGFLTVAHAAVNAGVNRFVYASSSSVYGDNPDLPKRELKTGNPLSPYAASKVTNEVYARALSALHPVNFVGLRYFNVFGPRQDPDGAYAAVIPRWIQTMLDGKQCHIFGDGKTSRDFCYIKNVVQANILAACVPLLKSNCSVYNVAVGESATLQELHQKLVNAVHETGTVVLYESPVYESFREGDVKHSLADIKAIESDLSYSPEWFLNEGLKETVSWYASKSAEKVNGISRNFEFLQGLPGTVAS